MKRTRCLIVERHRWETGFTKEQLQIPKDAFKKFFGQPGDVDVDIYASLSSARPTRSVTAKISAYPGSATYRINRVEELGRLPEVLVFIEERKAGGKVTGYDVWWEVDTVLVAAKFAKWNKAKDSQYGRGRLWTIVNGPVHRPLRW